MNGLMFLSEADMRECLSDQQAVLKAVADGVRAVAEGQAKSFPTVAMESTDETGAIYTIRGVLTSLGLASVKTVGSFPGNHSRNLPPDPGLITLIDAATGVPTLIAGASFLTTIRTAAMTAVATAHLARPGARVIGCIGARGIAPLAARMIANMLDAPTIKVHSRSDHTRASAVREMRSAGLEAVETASWDDCIEGSDIVIDGAGLSDDAPLLRGSMVARGALVISYGAKCSLDEEVLPQMDRVLVDRWDPTPTGAMGPLIASGAMSESRIDAYLGEVMLGKAQGRVADGERILFWHRGLGACDIMLAELARRHALNRALGTELKYL
jgi:ornithine cyclodeaminase